MNATPDGPLPCLTVMQPWATLIALGLKRVETRNWMRDDLVGRRLAIHAAARWTAAQHAFAAGTPVIRQALEDAGYKPSGASTADGMLPLGAVVATVRVAGFAEYAALAPSSWRRLAVAAMGDQDHGRYGWLLDGAERLDRPIYTAGQRGLWTWRPAV